MVAAAAAAVPTAAAQKNNILSVSLSISLSLPYSPPSSLSLSWSVANYWPLADGCLSSSRMRCLHCPSRGSESAPVTRCLNGEAGENMERDEAVGADAIKSPIRCCAAGGIRLDSTSAAAAASTLRTINTHTVGVMLCSQPANEWSKRYTPRPYNTATHLTLLSITPLKRDAPV